MLLVSVTLDQQVYVMYDERNEHHGDTATESGHVDASQRTVDLLSKRKKRTVDLGVTHLDRQSCKKETIESIKEETVKTLCYT